MDARKSFLSWPVVRQVTGADPLGRGQAVTSARTGLAHGAHRPPPTGWSRASAPTARSAAAQQVFVKDGQVTQIEGDPDSPDLARAAVPQGLGQRAAGQPRRSRQTACCYRRPYGTEWEALDLDTAMDMIADRVVGHAGRAPGRTRDDQRHVACADPGHREPRRGDPRQRGELPHQEAVHRRWARCRSRTRPVFDTAPPSPVWGPRFGRGGATNFQQDLQQLRLHRHPGLEHGRVPPGGVPVGDGGQGPRRHGHPRRPAVHPHVARWPTCTCRSGPAPTSPSSAASSTTCWSNEQVLPRLRRGLHQRGDDRARGLPGHRGPRRRVLRLRPGDRALRHRPRGSYEGTDEHAGRRRARRRRRSTARRGDAGTQRRGVGTSGRRARDRRLTAARRRARAGAPRDETLQHPRCVFQVLKRHFSRYTPEMVQEVCGMPPETFLEVVRGGDRQQRPRAHHAPGSTRSAGRTTRVGRAVHPRRRDPAAAAGQHGPARRRHPGAARARQHPGLDRHPDAVQPAPGLPADAATRDAARRPATTTSTPTQPDRRASGATPTPTW